MSTVTEHCKRCESPLEHGDLRCAICGQAAPVADEANKETLVVQILRCTGCGAAVAYDAKRRAPSCSFCGEVMEVESIEDPMEQTEHYLPFTVSEDEARAALSTWLKSLGWFRPADLVSSAQLTHLKPLWWVAWVFDADAFVSWTADSNAGSGRSAWAPHAGQNNLRFDDILVSASRGLTEKEVSGITPGLNLSTQREQPEGASEDATLEQFDVQRSQARQQVAGAIQNIAAARVQQNHVPGSSFRNVHVSVVLRKLITRRLSLPAYVLAYRYKEQLYRVVICGQNTRLVVGSAPVSYFKIFLVVGMVLGAIALFFLIMAASAG